LSPQTYTAADVVEFDGTQLIWRTQPALPSPTKRAPEAVVNAPIPRKRGHLVGVGRAIITDVAAREARDKDSRLPMQGWIEPDQLSSAVDGDTPALDGGGTEVPLIARAFVLADGDSGTRAAIVVADMWSASIALKQAVVHRLSRGNPESPWTADNILIAGTHTHSGPGGYLHHMLYNIAPGITEAGPGFDPHVFESMVAGIVRAIETAIEHMAPGRLRVATGRIAGLTRNRSMPAFSRNPPRAQAQFPAGVDERVVQINFERRIAPGVFKPIGFVNWFAIHPTNLGPGWTRLSGDNKGWAAHLIETKFGPDFVAGFANGAAGDVTGNFLPGQAGFDPVTGNPTFDPVNGSPTQAHRDRMMATGEAQAREAANLVRQGGFQLEGPVQASEHRVDLVRRTRTVGAFGVSMAAGSTEDRGASPFPPEGIQLIDPLNPTQTTFGDLIGTLALPVASVANRLMIGLTALFSGRPLPLLLSSARFPPVVDAALVAQHFPKPILMVPGLFQPDSWCPEIVPVQVLRCGGFATVAIPAEVTTVAGERLIAAARRAFPRVEAWALTSYANGYASYVTTREEYAAQEYEGASTLYGAGMCGALEGAVRRLTQAMSVGAPVPQDAPLPDRSETVLKRRRITFRNLSGAPLRFRLFFPDDRIWSLPIADVTVEDTMDHALFVPFLPWTIFVDMVQVVAGDQALGPFNPPTLFTYAVVNDLIVATATGALVRADYFPPDRFL
jgi:neutral ceramidase